jgi:hypothetical protein
MKTHASLFQLTSEIQQLLSLPSFTQEASEGEPYCQFEMFGMQVFIHRTDEEERDPEVGDFPYRLDLQMAFTEHTLDTDTLEYDLQPYYAQLLAFHLDIDTAYHEKHKVGPHWQIHYRYCHKNPRWTGSLLFGETGWEPAIIVTPPTPWRTVRPMP